MKKNFWQNKKIVVTGGTGFLGSHLVPRLRKLGAGIFVPLSKKYDLRQKSACREVIKGQDTVIHLAAKVGGIGLNRERPGEMFYDNITMGVNLMEEARLAGISKFVNIGTVCSYPKFTPVPFKEEDFWNGYPEETNAPYGLAKKMLLVQSQAYRQQYGFNSILLVPVNMYGIGDNFNPASSHVIPALIKKTIEAKVHNKKEVVIWGTGKATREFLYVDDCVEAIILATERYNKSEPVNIGSNFEISISDLVKKICQIVGFKGNIIWDKTKPDGQPRRRLNTAKAYREFGFKAETKFNIGLEKTIKWFLSENYKL